MNVAQVIQDWRYPVGVIFAGAMIGTLVFKAIPAPPKSAMHLQRVFRAAQASVAARAAGVSQAENLADLIGVHEMALAMRALRRQRRVSLILSLIASAAGLLPVYMHVSIHVLPIWLYVVLGFVGLVQTWRMW